MARLPATELLLPFFVHAAIINDERGYSDPSLDLVDDVILRLSGECGGLPPDLHGALKETVKAFELDRSLDAYTGVPGPQRQLLGLLRDGADVCEALDAMAPEYVVELAGYLREPDAEWVMNPIGMPEEVIARVRRAAGRFERDYRPARGRRTDIALETAIRALVEVLQPLIGHYPKVAGNKNNGVNAPTPNCAGARAIETLLKGVDHHLTTTAIMNMILKVEKQPEPTEDPWLILMGANPIKQLDCCLHPGREEAIEAILAEDDPL